MRGSPHTIPDAPTSAVSTADAERALVARARLDPAAFAPLYEAYFDAVYRYCYHRLGDWATAEDAASLVFTNALAALPRARFDDGAGSFRAWLFAIAHNVVANHHRHRARHPARPIDDAYDVTDSAPLPDEAALASEAHRTVLALLERLPEDQRRLLELRLAGLTDAEIARVLGRQPAAIRTAQHRALVRLRALLGVGASPKEASDA